MIAKISCLENIRSESELAFPYFSDISCNRGGTITESLISY